MIVHSLFTWKNRAVIALFVLLFVFRFPLFSQKENNVWYFGVKAGIDFNGPTPVALTDGAINTIEGCASVADKNGNLLFYTDGITVWNSLHDTLLNGTDLKGHESSSQSAIIVPKPESDNIYYIFTTDFNRGTNGLNYSEIDMNLDGGLGGITSVKNVQLTVPTTEKLTSVMHSNCRDIWVIAHEQGSNTFLSYLVTPTGVPTIPMESNVGSVIPFVTMTTLSEESLGCLKASPDGNYIAAANKNLNAELFEFDKSTGLLSNPIVLNTTSNYGVEFSPSSERVYLSRVAGGSVYQYDLTASNIPGTETFIGGLGFGSLQLAPDNKIYVASPIGLPIPVIDNPDGLGAACNYIQNGFALGPLTQSRIGLPQKVLIPNNFLDPTISSVSPMCENNSSITLTAVDTGGVWSGIGIVDSLDGIFNPSVAGSGSHSIIYTITTSCYSVADTINIIVNSLLTDFIVNPISCNGACDGEILINITQGTPPFSYSWSSTDTISSINGLCPNTYSVIITDSLGCSDSNSIILTDPANVIVDLGDDIVTCDDSVTITAIASGGTVGSNGYQYNWNNGFANGQNLVVDLLSDTSSYMVTVTDDNNCTHSDTVFIFLNSVPAINFSIDTNNFCLFPQLEVKFTSIIDTTLEIPEVLNWDFGDGSPIENGLEVFHTYTSSGVYDVNLNAVFPDSTGGCISDSTKREFVTIFSNPVANFEMNPNPASSIDPVVHFFDQSQPSSAIHLWDWTFDEFGTSSDQEPIFTFPEDTGYYIITLTVTDSNNCINSVNKNLAVIAASAVYMPNAFTPNEDGVNDLYTPRGNGISEYILQIFDRWGEIVFQTNDISESWDGTKKGESVQVGVYVWKIDYKDINGDHHNRTGQVNLIK